MAGFFVKPLLVAGHDSLWYWTRARAFDQKNQKWNAYFYYTTAAYLASPADFLTSTNLEKLNQETANSRPDGLPGVQPMMVTAGGKTYSVNDLHTDGSLGGLDLVIRYAGTDVGDPVATRAQNLEVMKATLAAHPELREAFEALTPGRRKSYIFHVASAKQVKTRAARAARCVPMILSGRGFNELTD